MKWVLIALAALAGAVWFFRRRKREEPWEQAWTTQGATEANVGPATVTYSTDIPADTETEPRPEPAPAAEADPATREVESRSDDETKYERKLEAEIEERHAAAERLKNDPFTSRLEGGERPPGTTS